MGNFPVIDLIFLSLILLMLIHDYIKGFVEELFSWAALVLSVLAAVFFHSPAAAFIRTKTMENVRLIPEILGFAAIFIIVLIVIKLLEKLLKEIILGANLGGVNKILGAVFGLVEGFALTAIILFIISVQPLFDPSKVIGESIFAQFLLPFIRAPQSV